MVKIHTLFFECLAHENHPNFLKSLGHWPWPQVILILSKFNGLESNLQKTWCHNLTRSFAYYSQDHLTNSTWPGVMVSDPESRKNWMKSMCTSFGEECIFLPIFLFILLHLQAFGPLYWCTNKDSMSNVTSKYFAIPTGTQYCLNIV